MDRKKAIMLVKMFSTTLLIVAVAGIIGHFIQPSDKETAADVVQTGVEGNREVSVISKNNDETDSAEASEEKVSVEEFSQSDVDKLMVKYEAYEEQRNAAREQVEGYRSLPDGLTNAQIYEIAQSRIVQCYEENVLLAAEAKTLLIGGLGVTIPSIASDNSATEAYGEYLKEQLGISGLDSVDDLGDYLTGEIADGIIGQIGSESVQKAVRYGFDGALEAYKTDGTLDAVLNGAVDSVVDGVVSDLQAYPYELAKNALDEVTGGLFSVAEGMAASDSPEEFLKNLADEKTGGLVSSIASIASYQGSQTALFQSMARSAKASAAELSGFLEKDAVNSEDIANMMYQYSQYGEVLNDLRGYNWKNTYDAMAEVYTKFVSNEVMIGLLGSAKYTDDEEQATQEESALDGVQEHGGDEEFVLQGSTTEQYYALEERITALEAETKAYNEELKELRQSKLSKLRKYNEQFAAVKQNYTALIEYNVKNFEPQYDEGGSQIIERNKKINNAIGELSKYTPWGITLGLFSSMAMEDGNNDYAAMVSANDAFGTGLQTITIDTKAEIEKFKAQLTFYEELTNMSFVDLWYSYDDLRFVNENQYLMEYVLAGQDINLAPYADEVYKKLYIMGLEVDLIKNYYNTLLTSSDSKTLSIHKLDNQYNEIMEIVNPDGTGRIADLVTTEELAGYLMPLIDAGISAEDKTALVGATSALVDKKFQYCEYGRIHWYIKSGTMKVENDSIRIYFAGGHPVYVNGLYFYNGQLLNDGADTDADMLYETLNKMSYVVSQSDANKNVGIILSEVGRIKSQME